MSFVLFFIERAQRLLVDGEIVKVNFLRRH